MSLVLVTGISGAGKSAVCNELQRRGYEAHDTDRDRNAVWVDRETGEVTAEVAGASERPPGWLDRQEWRAPPARVEELAARAEGRLAFLCGATANEDEIWHLFSQTIYLAIDEETLRHRLHTRTTNDFGKAPHELAAVLEWHKVGVDQYRNFGAFIVDATQPLMNVVDDVIAIARSGEPAP
jgi:dephospho-CoA kinase